MIDHTKVKPGDRFRVIKRLDMQDAAIGTHVVVDGEIDIEGFDATDKVTYIWTQVEPIGPQLITRPIAMPEWLASTPKDVAVKCRVKYIHTAAWNTTPSWICGYRKALFIDENGKFWACAEPWTEAEEPDVQEERRNPMNQNGGPAFPSDKYRLELGHDDGRYEIAEQHPGMTLRDYFAATVDPDLKFDTFDSLARFMGEPIPQGYDEYLKYSLRATARVRYMMADAMLEERSKS